MLTWLEGCLGGRKHRKAWSKAVGKAGKATLVSLWIQGHRASPWPTSTSLRPRGWR